MNRDTVPFGRAGLVVDALASLGDYLRERELVAGYGFEKTYEGVVCSFQDCRFAEVAHEIAENEGVACAECPVFQLMEEALKKRDPNPFLRDHAVLVKDGVTCVFHLDLTFAADETGE
jgi:hypothetical protein